LILDYFFSVGGFAVVTLLAVVWRAIARTASARRWLIAIVIFYSAASIRAFPWVLSRPLVLGFHPFTTSDVPADRTAIVLLGAGSFTVHGRNARIGVMDLAGAARVLEATDVYRKLGSPWVVSSGGAAGGFQTIPSSETMRMALIQLGVPDDRIVLESTSHDTHDEAVLVTPMLRALQVRHVVLVTSEVHMRRSLATFHAAGIDAVPAIAPDPLNFESHVRSFVPTTEGLRFSSGVAHEYIGLVYYWLRGWIRFSS
jgi:uncharacterized SAM-binding protein YcdF (DUF218 family)